MLEIYEIIWRDEQVTGWLEYDTSKDKFQAYLREGEQGNPRALFGVTKTDSVIDDKRVRFYISECVVPKTRENIDDILKHLKLPYYDQWEIYKRNNGKNASDYASIRLLDIVHDKDFFYPGTL